MCSNMYHYLFQCVLLCVPTCIIICSSMDYHYLSECDIDNAPSALYLVIWHQKHGRGELVNTHNNNLSCPTISEVFAAKTTLGGECVAGMSSENMGGLHLDHSLNSMSGPTCLYTHLAIKLILVLQSCQFTNVKSCIFFVE